MTSTIDITIINEYLLIAGIFLMFFNFLPTLFYLVLRSDAMHIDTGLTFGTNVAVLVFEVSFIFGSMIIFSSDSLLGLLALPLFCTAVIFTITMIWATYQMGALNRRSMEVLETLVGVIEAGDENLDGHSLHVQNLSMLIYDYLPFYEKRKINPMNLQYASLFLDIGKLGIPRSIIDKRGKLTPREKQLIQRHPEICVEIFEKIPSFTNVTYWVKYHHERVDGTGYYHMKGNDIPLASRILAVADTYSAITMPRSYRPSLSHESAVAELRLVAGSQLDEYLVNLFCAIPQKKVLECMTDVRDRMKKYQSGDFKW